MGVSVQGLNELVSSALHALEIVAQRAGAVEHQHDDGALEFLVRDHVARRRKFSIVHPRLIVGAPIPLFGIGSVDLVSVGREQVAERKVDKNTFCGGVDDAAAVLQTHIGNVAEKTTAIHLVVEEHAFDVPLRFGSVGDVVESEADTGVVFRGRGFQGDVPR